MTLISAIASKQCGMVKMQNIYVYVGTNPINPMLAHNLMLIESQFEENIVVKSLHTQPQLDSLLKNGEVIHILFFNEFSNIEQIKRIARAVRARTRDTTLFVFPMLYANFLAKELHQLGPVTFIEDNADKAQLESIIFYWEKHYIQSLYYVYRNNRKMIVSLYSDILYFESEKKHIHIVTCYGTDKFAGKINDVYDRIKRDTCIFVRTHQSYIVNINKIMSMTSHAINMINGACVPISNNRLDNVNTVISSIVTPSNLI